MYQRRQAAFSSLIGHAYVCFQLLSSDSPSSALCENGIVCLLCYIIMSPTVPSGCIPHGKESKEACSCGSGPFWAKVELMILCMQGFGGNYGGFYGSYGSYGQKSSNIIVGATGCVLCSAGQFSAFTGATICQACPPGANGAWGVHAMGCAWGWPTQLCLTPPQAQAFCKPLEHICLFSPSPGFLAACYMPHLLIPKAGLPPLLQKSPPCAYAMSPYLGKDIIFPLLGERHYFYCVSTSTYQPMSSMRPCLFSPPKVGCPLMPTAVCLLSGTGTYQPAANSSSCISAPAGTYTNLGPNANPGASTYTACPVGTYTQYAGSNFCQ